MKISKAKLARLMRGLGIAQVKLDLSGMNPRIRLTKFWSHALRAVEDLLTCYYGKQRIAVVPSVAWKEFCRTTRKEFERANANTSFEEWVAEPARDVVVKSLEGAVRWYLLRDHLEWASIPLKKGTKLFLCRERLWIIISTVRKDPNQVPTSS